MAEQVRLRLGVCSHYAADVEDCLREMGRMDIEVSPFPARCGLPPLRADEVPQGGATLLLGGCCLAELERSGGPARICRLGNCQELLLAPGRLEGALSEGAYVLTTGWLRNWREHLAALGGDPELVGQLMREGTRRLLCLDGGREPVLVAQELPALGLALGLPTEVQPLDRVHLSQRLQALISCVKEPEAAEASQALKEARGQAADRSLALEFLSELSQTLLESEVKARIEGFFRMLFGAGEVRLLEPGCSDFGGDEEYRMEEAGFRVRLGRPGQEIGILRVAELSFPQYRSYYLNLVLSTASVCVLAVRNARAYRALDDAQTSQRLMLDVLEAFYHPGEHLEELDAVLDLIHAHTRIDAVAIRLNREGGMEFRARGMPPGFCGRERDLRLRDPSGAVLDHPDGGPVLGCVCGQVLAGRLPEGLPGRTSRGGFWSPDLEESARGLASWGLPGGFRGVCLEEGYRSFAVIPLATGREPLGLLQVCHREPGRFDAGLMHLLEGVAGSIALGLERRFAEERLRLLNQELERRVDARTAELAMMNQALRQEIAQRSEVEREKSKVEQQLLQAQKLEAIGTLAGGIAHDFNNILTPILGFAEMGLQQAEGQGSLRRCFEMILKAGLRARELSNQILVFSRRQEQPAAPIHVGPVLKEVLKMLRATLPATVEIRQSLDSEDSVILANPTHLHQIVVNLCTNAAQAMEAHGGILEVDLQRVRIAEGDPLAALHLPSGPYVALQVGDTGCGMSPEVQARIFEPFFTTKDPNKGTGLGLSVVHGLVKSYRGHISVYSERGQGTVFRIYLPEAEGTAVRPAPEDTHRPGGHERILVVDDDAGALQTLQALLEGLGYQVAAFSDSSEALACVRERPEAFDLVVTDMTLPRMTGLDLAAALRGVRADLPIVLCSGYGLGMVRDQGREADFSGFIQKPYTAVQVAQTIRGALTPA